MQAAKVNDAYKFFRAQGEGMCRAFSLARAEAVCKREGIKFEWEEEEESFLWEELALETGLSVDAYAKKFDLFCLVGKRGKEILDCLSGISFEKSDLNREDILRIYEADMALNIESHLHDEWQEKADELASRATYAG